MAVHTSNFSTFASDSSSGGSQNLDQTSDAQYDDASYCIPGNPTPVAGSDYTTYYLKCTDLVDDVPSGTITGIEIYVKRKAANNTALAYTVDWKLYIVKGGTIQTAENKADTGTKYPTSDGTATYGSSSDTWSQSWTTADINGSGFGMVLAMSVFGDGDGDPIESGDPSINHVYAKIYYTGSSSEEVYLIT